MAGAVLVTGRVGAGRDYISYWAGVWGGGGGAVLVTGRVGAGQDCVNSWGRRDCVSYWVGQGQAPVAVWAVKAFLRMSFGLKPK